jgi:hypothetical protein
MVAFRSANIASVNATFAEQKATMFCIIRIKSQPIYESGFRHPSIAEQKTKFYVALSIVSQPLRESDVS